MKNKKIKLSVFAIALSICLLTMLACSKPENGAQGPPGSANVISSNWISASATVRDSTIDGTCIKVRHFTAPELSTDILNKGQMLTYLRVGTIGPIQLPYLSDAGGATNQINCSYSLKKIIIYRHTFNTCRYSSSVAAAFAGQPVMIILPASLEYRYILIPPANATSRMEQPNFKTMTYSEVCKYLNLKE